MHKHTDVKSPLFIPKTKKMKNKLSPLLSNLLFRLTFSYKNLKSVNVNNLFILIISTYNV